LIIYRNIFDIKVAVSQDDLRGGAQPCPDAIHDARIRA
jgi:hypothetical protein